MLRGFSSQLSIDLAAERRQIGELVHLVLDGDALPLHEIGHGSGATGIANPMGAVRCAREIAAAYLVGPLRAGFHPPQSPCDGEVDGAVVARLEMQEREIAEAAPVAAIERVAADEIERAGDEALLLLAHHEDDLLRHAPADEVEERAVEIG